MTSSMLQIKDEYWGSADQPSSATRDLRLVSSRTSAREIIRERVLAEVEQLNTALSEGKHQTGAFIVTPRPNSPEALLNEPRRGLRHAPDLYVAEQEIAKAYEGFQNQRFVMLFDDQQVSSLDTVLTVTENSEAVFLHLTPLRGG